jgi:hypothetical protein
VTLLNPSDADATVAEFIIYAKPSGKRRRARSFQDEGVARAAGSFCNRGSRFSLALLQPDAGFRHVQN